MPESTKPTLISFRPARPQDFDYCKNLYFAGMESIPYGHHRNCVAGGYARAAVAGQLLVARDDGVREAILFAESPAAIHAYEAVGFRKIGDFGITILKEPWFGASSSKANVQVPASMIRCTATGVWCVGGHS